MKRILSFLTLAAFAIASQMPLLHAMDMENASLQNSGEMQMVQPLVFCGNETKKQNDTPQCCLHQMFPDTLVQAQGISLKKIGKVITILPFAFQETLVLSVNNDIPQNIHAPPDIFQKSNYRNLIGIVKNLN